jgi:hypothetical protein
MKTADDVVSRKVIPFFLEHSRAPDDALRPDAPAARGDRATETILKEGIAPLWQKWGGNIRASKLARDLKTGSVKKVEQHPSLLLVFFGKQWIAFCNVRVSANELNRKGKTRRFSTLFTIRPWQKLKEIQCLQLGSHGVVGFDLASFFVCFVNQVSQPGEKFFRFLLILDFGQCYVKGMEGNQYLILPDGQGIGRMIVDAPLQGGIQIRKDLMDFFGDVRNHPDLHRVGQTGEDTRDFIGMEKHGPSYSKATINIPARAKKKMQVTSLIVEALLCRRSESWSDETPQ